MNRLTTIVMLCLIVCFVIPMGEAWSAERVLGGAGLHGIHGLVIADSGEILVGSLFAQSIYGINPETGRIRAVVPPPHGAADDLVFDEQSRLVWTSMYVSATVNPQLFAAE